jgi:hypothetical protein
MKKLAFFVLIVSISALQGLAQNAADALRFSQQFNGSTSRSSSLGGAMGAMGGDQGAVGVNPGGLGVFRKSEFSFTPYLSYTTSEATLNDGPSFKDFAYGLGVKQLGFVAAFPTYNESGLISFNMNFSYNNQNIFRKYTGIRNPDASNSLLDDFTWDANQSDWYYTGNELAYETDLIYFDEVSDSYMSDFTASEYGQSQRHDLQQKGSAGEYQLGMAANFNNNLFVGFNVGINSLRYESVMSHTEYNVPEEIPYLNAFEYSTSLKTNGLGFNGKLGLIYTPLKWLRLGIAAHSPVFYSLEDRYSGKIVADLNMENPVKPESVTNSGRFDYQLVSPPKVVFSGGIVLGKIGFISADYDIVDFSVMRLRSDDYTFADENDDIQTIYSVTHNLRVGGEIRQGMMSYRGGVAYYQSPYKTNELNADSDQLGFSAGIGINTGDYFVDFAYVNRALSSSYVVYNNPQAQLIADLQDTEHQFMFTIGYKF